MEETNQMAVQAVEVEAQAGAEAHLAVDDQADKRHGIGNTYRSQKAPRALFA